MSHFNIVELAKRSGLGYSVSTEDGSVLSLHGSGASLRKLISFAIDEAARECDEAAKAHQEQASGGDNTGHSDSMQIACENMATHFREMAAVMRHDPRSFQ